jgi:hypothetical protein
MGGTGFSAATGAGGGEATFAFAGDASSRRPDLRGLGEVSTVISSALRFMGLAAACLVVFNRFLCEQQVPHIGVM